FSSIAILADENEESGADKKFRKAGVLKWLCELLHNQNILDENYMAKIDIAAVIYDYGQATSLPVIDSISDSLVFHSKLLLEVSHVWRERIIQEIEKCDRVATAVYSLYKDLQKASGRRDKDAKESQSGEIDAKMQFYDKIDYPFRLWLAGLDPMTMELDNCVMELETKLLKIAFDFGDELTAQSGSNAIFGRYSKPEKEKKVTEITSSAQALNLFRSKIKKIFESAGEKNEQE
ncbi:MAG: type I-E CRISPR-associated protein Cse1/CasA, partial [Oscillospiraceae bacterium]|nr:type I-E CRISPR-associated protein Cse1/CasA [Oscillospiraceae bacterium]